MAKPKATSPTRGIDPSQQQNGQSQNEIISQQWSGPLPPPGALAQFNDIIPNGAERIMQMVEREQAHRLQHENAGLQAHIKDTRRGHWMGAVIGVGCVAGSVFTAYIDAHPAVSVALVSVPVLGIIRAFIVGKNQQT